MRPDRTEASTPANQSGRGRTDRAAAVARKSQLRRLALEPLEAKALMAVAATPTPATLPALVSDGNPNIDIDSPVLGDESAPTIIVSHNDPNKLIAAWTNINNPNLAAPVRVLSQAAYSIDGGQNWETFFTANLQADHTTAPASRLPFTRAENTQVALDRDDNLYILHVQRNEANSAGALVLNSFNFSGASPTGGTTRVLQRWTTNVIRDTHLVVDDTLPTFTDPTTGETVTNPASGNVYISYITTDTAPALNTTPFNPNRVFLIASSDGGATFSAPRPINDGGNRGSGGNQRNAAPRVAVSQGTADGRIPAGLVNIVWDDFGSGATATPPRDLILAEQVLPGVATQVTGTGAIDDFNTTNIPIEVTAGDIPAGFTTLSDLNLRLTITHPNLDQLTISLIPPQASGRNPITILNAADITGANLGILNGINIGTIFDDSASRNIFDPNAGGTNANTNPYIDSYRPRTGSFAGAFNGMTGTAGPDGVIGTWTLRITDNTLNAGAIQGVDAATLFLTSGLEVDPDLTGDPADAGNTTIAQTFVRGGLDGVGQTASAATPIGIAPAPVIAADNTLGSFSPFQGRIYAAFTNYIHPTPFGGSNPTDNTDIHLSFSDDGGVTWTAAHSFFNPVNDDAGNTDGFSEAIIDSQNQIYDGRPQFNPAIAVDQTTGMLVMGWYDARHDAARARVATYLATSIDGGSSFGSQVFANPDRGNVSPTTGATGGGVVDAITGRPVVLGPLPDNQSPGNPVRDTVYGYGRRIGLVAANGVAFPAWSGNQNFAGLNNDGVNASQRLDIYASRVAIGAGPRVVEGTSGPITGQAATALADGSIVAINATTDSDGTPLLDGLVVTFDRPIYRDPNAVSDPLNFGLDDIKVFFRDTTLGNATSLPVSIGDIIPLVDPDYVDSSILDTLVAEILALDPDLSDAEALALARVEQQRRLGATRFYVKFATPRGGVGTYSYQVGPQYRDRIRTANADGSVRNIGNTADQNADGTTGQPLVNGAITSQVDVFMMPRPVGQFIALSASGAVLAPFSSDSLPIILNGPRVAAVTAPGEPAGDALAVDRVVQGLDITFDRDIQVSSFSPTDVLTVDGPTGAITGPFTVRPAWRSTVAAPIPDSPATPLVSTILIQGNGPFTIADLDISVEIRHAHAADLTLTLIGPNGVRVPLAALLGGPIGADYRDTTFDDGGVLDGDPLGRSKSLLSINQAPAPFTGRYRPVGSLASFNGLDIAGEWKLEIVDATAGNSAGSQLVAWSLTATPADASPDVVARTFRIEFFSATGATPQSTILPNIQEVSGTYAVTLSSNIVSGRGDLLDEDRDAGLDLLRGVDPAGRTTLVQATAAPNLPLGDAVGTTPTTTSSSIVVTDDFLVQGLTLQLNINHNRVRDLTAVLVTPAGDRVTLFSPTTLRVNGANFSSTTFDDNAPTFVFDGGPPYFGSFRPEQALSDAYIDPAGNSRRSAGTYTLEITDSQGGVSGTLVNWTLNFRKPQTGDGLGEEVADRPRTSFRIFTMDATNPLSSTNWTAVGPASVTAELPFTSQQRWAGRIGAIAVDPSDPSGNTVYVAGASGGVWKTNNFLTTNPAGPVYIPLTDFGPNFSTNIGSIAVFGRNGDPNQSIIYVATGEGDDSANFGTNQTGRGIGFLRSMDGGRTWEVLDSTDNTLAPNSPQRNRAFVGMTAFKVVVDPTPSTTGEVLVYAALSGTGANGATGGLWRSDDGGDTWRKLSVDGIHGTQATDLVLDPFSTDVTSRNLDRFHVAFRDSGVFRATSRGDNLTRLVGGVGKPLVQDPDQIPTAIAVGNGGDTPPLGGRIVVAQPAPSGIAAQDLSYQDWLYAAAVEGGSIVALYTTKDRGENWTRVEIPATAFSIPTNDLTKASLNLGQGEGLNGNFAITLAVDPTNPAVVYLGGNLGDGNTLIRLDTTIVHDAHNLTVYDPSAPDGGLMNAIGGTNGAGSSAATLKDPNRGLPVISDTFSQSRVNPDGRFPFRQAINVARNPLTPLAANATFFINNVAQFVNDGSRVFWTPFTDPLLGANGVHDLVTFVDPLTGQARLIIGTDQGVYTAVDDNGRVNPGIGSAISASGTRNGNLQIAQVHYGAAQPVNGLADLFRAMSWQIDFPASAADILETGNLAWTDTGASFQGSGSGVATAQVDDTSRGAVYEYKWPGDGGRFTDFFQVNGVGRTVGLLRGQNDPQWFGLSPVIAPGIRFGNFTVNSINNNQVIISSGEGRIYSTEDQGRTWREIGVPTVFGGPSLAAYAPALAFGAPEPGATAPGSLNDFLYVGTVGGRIFVTRTGGGAAGTEWTEISNGLDGSSVLNIITSPNRGTREAYAVTRSGIYYIADSTGGGAWQNVTGNLFSLRHNPFGNTQLAEDSLVDNELHSLTADWRYLIPEDPYSTTNLRVHPILYASGNGGVVRSLDNGQSWTSFPDNVADNTDPAAGTPADYGYLPNVRVTDLDLSLGFVNPDNGRPIATNSPNLLVASTFGRGQFAIRLAPLILEETARLHPTLPAPGGSDSGIVGIAGSNTDRVTNVVRPVLQGIGEQTAFGNTVRITIYDLTDPINPRIIGGYDPADPATDILENYTDDAGMFAVQVYEDAFLDGDGQVVQGLKNLGIQAINASGTRGNMVEFDFTLDTIAPLAPATPDLTLASDTGPVNFPDPANDGPPNFPNNRADNYTSDNTPEFAVAGIEADNVVYLFRDNTLVRTVTGAPAGTLTIGDPGPVPPGRYLYTVRQVDRAGNASPVSSSVEVVIDTTVPNTPSRPALVAADDTGIVGDNITANTSPRVTGSLGLITTQPDAEAVPANLPLVQIISTSGQVLGQARVGNDGTYTVVFDQPLSPGGYIVRVQAVDRAGNLSGPSQSLTLTIDTSAPPAVTLQLDPRDDTGTASDNITSIRRPRLLGTTGPNLSVQIIDVDGTITGTPGAPVGAAVPSQPNGLFTLQLPTILPDGLYRLVARATNTVGNTSSSSVLELRIDATPPGGVPDLRLDPPSDTGVKGDGRTSLRRPLLAGTTDPGAAVEIVGPNGTVLSSGVADSTGQFRLQLASNLTNGTIDLRARSRDVAGNLGGLSAPFRLTIETTRGDYDADGRADLALFRDFTTDTTRFTILRSAFGLQVQDFGRPGDIPLHADFDGDGITDLAVFRPESDLLPGSSEWFILGSRTGARRVQFGGSGLDLPAPADFDGDGIADLAVFRPNSDLLPGSSEWFILGSSSGPRREQFGKAGDDVPVPADFDGDGRADLAVFRPASDLAPGSAHWFVAFSSGTGVINQPFGEANADLPVAADFNGDGRVDIGLFRPSTAQWFVLPTGTGGLGAYLQAFGAPGDFPAPADYDGDGTADLAVFRPSTAQWTVRNSSTGGNAVTPLGTAADIPVLSPLAYLDDRPGTIVSPRNDSTGGPAFNSLAGRAAFSAATAPAAPPASLDFGQTANFLSAGGSTTSTAPAATTTKARPAQAALAAHRAQQQAAAQDSGQPTTRSTLLGWLRARRTGRRSV